MLKKLSVILISLLLLTSIYICYSLICIFTFDGTINEENLLDKDYIVILGARVYEDQPGPKLKERLDYALSLLSKTTAKIIVSGGQGPDEDFHESVIMRNYLVENGINQDRIILEDKATSTWENLKFSKELIKIENAKVLVISSDYHMFRINMLVHRMNLEWDVTGSITKDKIEAIKREVMAILKSYIFDR
ncbi:MAG: YdcF family protein [Mycoplasmatales bacterium]